VTSESFDKRLQSWTSMDSQDPLSNTNSPEKPSHLSIAQFHYNYPILIQPNLMPISCTPDLCFNFLSTRFLSGRSFPNIHAFSQQCFIFNLFWRICVFIGFLRFCISPAFQSSQPTIHHSC